MPLLLKQYYASSDVPSRGIGDGSFFLHQVHGIVGRVAEPDQDAAGHRHTAPPALFTKDGNAPAGVDDGQRSLDAGVQLLHGHGYKYRISGRQMNHPNIRVSKKIGRHTLAHAQYQAHALLLQHVNVLLSGPGSDENGIGDFGYAHNNIDCRAI